MAIELPTDENPVVLIQGDCLEILRHLPDDSIDLLVTSPPYELARTYGIKDKMFGGQKWVDWMVEIIKSASPKVKGLIAIVCEGQTRNFKYTCTPFLLVADLHRAGFNLRKPAVFRRVGIPGSGGPDWLRNDWEPIVCVTRPGKLVWSDNTAMGHIPKWAPGGEMSYQTVEGRVNARPKTMGELMHERGGNRRSVDGTREKMGQAVSKIVTRRKPNGNRGEPCGTATSGIKNGDAETVPGHYFPPPLANPGNVIDCNVGGGVMGHILSHENEAPYPLDLAAFFVKSFCPPGGIVLDCFCGSGTTGHAAIENGRRFIGIDIRQSQIDLTRRRLASGITPELFV